MEPKDINCLGYRFGSFWRVFREDEAAEQVIEAWLQATLTTPKQGQPWRRLPSEPSVRRLAWRELGGQGTRGNVQSPGWSSVGWTLQVIVMASAFSLRKMGCHTLFWRKKCSGFYFSGVTQICRWEDSNGRKKADSKVTLTDARSDGIFEQSRERFKELLGGNQLVTMPSYHDKRLSVKSTTHHLPVTGSRVHLSSIASNMILSPPVTFPWPSHLLNPLTLLRKWTLC